jgi:integrase
MAKELTARSIAQLKPGKTRREIHDGRTKGLYLHVQPSGAKSWAMLLTRPDGKPGKLHLGPVDLSGREHEDGRPGKPPPIGQPLTLADARWWTDEIHERRKRGRDVIAEALADKEQKRRRAEAPSNTFAAVAQQFIDEHARPQTRRWKETAHYLGLDYQDDEPTRIKGGLAERWKDKDIAAITSDDVYRVIDETKRQGAPGLPCRTDGISNTRGRAMARALSKLFGWALQHRKIKASPSVGVFVPPQPKPRDRVLTEAEIIRFWKATDQLAEPFRALHKLLLLTGQRLREVAGMRRAELSPDATLWTIPGSRTKNKRVHDVPLPSLARDILANVRQIAGKPGYVFSTNGRTPVSGFSKTKLRLDELMLADGDDEEIPPWRVHDLRRSAATIMADSPPKGLGIAPHVVEALLNHVSGHRSGVAGVYNLAQYGAEKQAALERWALHLQGLVSGRPANVTQLRRPKGKRS